MSWYRRLRLTVPALLGAVILLVMLVVALAPKLLAPHPPDEQVRAARLLPPFASSDKGAVYPLGSDNLGRDILSRMVYGTRTSLAIGLLAAAVSLVLGVGLGVLAGWFDGWLSDVVMRVADIQLAFPYILLALALMAVLGPSFWNLVIVLGVSNWVVYARLVRSEVLVLRELDHVQAVRALGALAPRIIWRHLLPNVLPTVIVLTTFNTANAILAEAGLSFLGLGLPRDIVSWGSMIADGREYVDTAWWFATFPGVSLMLTVMGMNLFGDFLRDRLDPRLRRVGL